jgi:hypothetical protein
MTCHEAVMSQHESVMSRHAASDNNISFPPIISEDDLFPLKVPWHKKKIP